MIIMEFQLICMALANENGLSRVWLVTKSQHSNLTAIDYSSIVRPNDWFSTEIFSLVHMTHYRSKSRSLDDEFIAVIFRSVYWSWLVLIMAHIPPDTGVYIINIDSNGNTQKNNARKLLIFVPKLSKIDCFYSKLVRMEAFSRGVINHRDCLFWLSLYLFLFVHMKLLRKLDAHGYIKITIK